MKRYLVLLGSVGVLSVAFPAGGDYLYDVIRAECQVPATCSPTNLADCPYYSAAEPVIGTVPVEETEVGRIGSNYLVYSGFRYYGANKYTGHLYGIRLYRENGANTNDWVFTDTGAADLLETCGEPESACLFDAGQRLKVRTRPRRILVGRPGTPDTTSAGAFTLPNNGAASVDLDGDGNTVPSTSLSSLRDIWEDYVALAPIADALPRSGRVCIANCDRKQDHQRTYADGWDCPTIAPVSLCDPNASQDAVPGLRAPSDEQLREMIRWLHGKRRDWPLGDIYHSSAAVVEPPAFEYKNRGYPEFRELTKDRPHMIYVGANDGMIHAFFATHDFKGKAQAKLGWKPEPGDEAWAYLPVNMLARTLIASDAGEQRFFSQDLSCRFTDVQVDTKFTTCTSADQALDKYCGWRTVLLCGQGWGGSWYVALDVTDPLEPKPLWEFTHLGSDGNGAGLGRTWSLPALSLVAKDKKPVWLATFGNGMNSSMTPDGASTRLWYRNLNLPFAGGYPYQGQGSKDDVGHAYVLNVATGALLADLSAAANAPNPFIADGTVLDFDGDGLADAAYMASYQEINRVALHDANDISMCQLDTLADDLKGKAVLSGHPTAFVYPSNGPPHPVVLVYGSGIDSGRDPDEQANNGKQWGVFSKRLAERDTADCSEVSPSAFCANLDFGFNDGSKKARLLGAPLFTRRARTGDNTRPYDDLLVYTIWTAPHHNDNPNQMCGDKGVGNAHLLCMDVTLKANGEPRCMSCDGFSVQSSAKCTCDPDEDPADTTCVPCTGYSTGHCRPCENKAHLYSGSTQAPSPPVAADGRVYVTDPEGGIEMVEVHHDGNNPNANSNRPSTSMPPQLISWREVYLK